MAEPDLAALTAHTVAVSTTLDCVEAYRHQAAQADAHRAAAVIAEHTGIIPFGLLPPLFAGAGGNRDGREAVKKCARLAAKTWARRGGRGGGVEARACLVMARALAEATEAFLCAGGGGTEARLETEGCHLVVVEVEAHCGEVSMLTGARGSTGAGGGAGATDRRRASEAAARSRAGLLRALTGRSFCSRLAKMLLENMPNTTGNGKLGVEVERLRALLVRHSLGERDAEDRIGFHSKNKGVGGRGREKSKSSSAARVSGSDILLDDMMKMRY